MDKNVEVVNVKIGETRLGSDDHGGMTAWLMTEWGSSSQGFGGYSLHYYGVEYIERILQTVGVDFWEDLKGKYIRIKRVDRMIKAIGHITEDQWFNPEEEDKNKK